MQCVLQIDLQGKFDILPSQEDGHTAIEQYLTSNYGEVGKKVHTGRSRNDQSLVMVDLQLLTIDVTVTIVYEEELASDFGRP